MKYAIGRNITLAGNLYQDIFSVSYSTIKCRAQFGFLCVAWSLQV